MLLRVVAIVDIGSNSVKVLVAKMQHDVIEEIHMDAETTSLARNIVQTGKLSDEAMLATLAALERFQSKIAELKVTRIKVVGTAAMREASNTQEFVEKIKEIFPSSVEIITGIEEARIALQGAMTARPDNLAEADCLFADLGGASTEVGFSKPTQTLVSTSLGALKTHNALNIGGGPIEDTKWKMAQDHVWSVLEKEITPELRNESKNKKTLIAVGGTIVMATAALGLSPFKTSCFAFKRSELEAFSDRLRKIDEVARAQIPKLRRDRADILPFGIMVLTQIMKYLGQENGISTVRGLRHGFAKELLASKT
jgi:exopolyphosphatase/guanosine-5'-triphosphate,3'-diphosphate pyrophosphatase